MVAASQTVMVEPDFAATNLPSLENTVGIPYRRDPV